MHTSIQNFLQQLDAHGIGAQIFVNQYTLSHVIDRAELPLAELSETSFAGTRWTIHFQCRETKSATFQCALQLTTDSATNGPVAAGIHFQYSRWSRDHYLLMPGAVYAGNRFLSQPTLYVSACDNVSPDMPVTITNVPRLEIGRGRSVIQLLSGDMSTPGAGWHAPESQQGFFLLTGQGGTERSGDHSLRFEEDEARREASLEITSPGVREGVRYAGRVSTDRAAMLSANESIRVDFTLSLCDAPDVPTFYAHYFRLRDETGKPVLRREEIPLSACREIQHAKYNAQNWVDEYGYYAVGMQECPSQDWQTGWVGGANAAYPLLAEGDEETRSRAMRTWDFIFSQGQSVTGLLRGCFSAGKWHDAADVLTRYSTDGLYFALKSILLMEARGEAGRIPHSWRHGSHRLAVALRTLWRENGQLGQRLDADTGEIVVGETLGASLAPGAFVLAAQIFGEPEWETLAAEIADHFWEKFLVVGVTNGGPGDILTAPDSESVFALLESFVVLHEATGEQRWLDRSLAAAHQCASWVMNYDFRFPPESTFGTLDMLTAGTVFANVQNKHSAPGICTLSGAVLLALFRASGDTAILRLIEQIAHAIPQFMSRADRPITDRRPGQRWPVLAPGWVNERVNTSDWEERGDPDEEIRVGEVFGGSTWSEAALLLTQTELPGIYARPDDWTLMVCDHVQADWSERDGEPTLVVRNPTKFPALVKIQIESAAESLIPCGAVRGQGLPTLTLAAGESVVVRPADFLQADAAVSM